MVATIFVDCRSGERRATMSEKTPSVMIASMTIAAAIASDFMGRL